MKVTPELVSHVARLARLELDEEQAQSLGAQMEQILDYIGLLDEADIEGLPPTSHVVDVANVMREDEVRPSLPVDKGLANAPEREGTAFRVPRIIEDQD